MKMAPANTTRLMIGSVLAVVALLAIGGWQLTRTSAANTTSEEEARTLADQVIVVDNVDRQTLEDTVVLHGQVTSDESFVLFAGGEGLVTGISATEDDRVAAGDELLRINGRPMVAVDQEVPFWRPLSRASIDGTDVVMLEQFLDSQGYDPGPVDETFDQDTTDALERWQEDNDYPVDGVFRPTDVAIGTWPATIGQMDLDVGSVVGLGQPLVRFVEDELSVLVTIDPTDRSRLVTGLEATITVVATDTEGTGAIVELSDRTELDQVGNELYRGEIHLDQDLGVVEGTEVRVEVVLARVENAMVVPVAAVLMNDEGHEEVRIVNQAGTIDRVQVTTGLTEGAMVEVTSGLTGNERVVIDVKYE